MGKHIIICSANSALLDAASRTFGLQGPRFSVCESGLEVLGAVGVVEADLLILDMQTPGLNGLLIISAVRELAPKLPILAVSAYPQEDARTFAHKGVSYITLPSGSNGGARAFSAVLAQVGQMQEMGFPTGAGTR